jgi:hypothetical protein
MLQLSKRADVPERMGPVQHGRGLFGGEVKKRQPGFYWVEIVHWAGNPIIARWNGSDWVVPAGLSAMATPRVRRVISGRITPPGKGSIPLPLERVLLDTGKGYREELRIERINAATGSVYVNRGK